MASIQAKLEALVNPAPLLADIDDDEDGDVDGTWARAREHEAASDDDQTTAVGQSSLRKAAAISLADLDEKYGGQKVARSAAFDSNEPTLSVSRRRKPAVISDEQSHSSDVEDSDDGSEDYDDNEEGPDVVEMDDSNESDADESRDRKVSNKDEKNGFQGIKMSKALATVDLTTQQKKGKAVHKQLQIWESLLALRIKLQACMRSFNELPRPNLGDYMTSADDATKADLTKAKRNVADILEVLIAAQDRLLSTCPHTKHLVTGGKAKVDSDEEIESSPDEGDSDDDGSIPDYRGESDSDEKQQISRPVGRKSIKKAKKKRRTAEAYSKLLTKRFKDYQPFRNATLTKWDERTRLTAGGKMAANKDFSGFDSSLLKQIDTILADKHRLIKRTQTKRSDIERIGSDSTATVDAEIFDDDDFYQQLLRELIERKSADITDPVAMSRQWLEVQKLRQKRAKKKVDTKASKGRKVRFEVMAKLVNFQAPNAHSSWTDDAKSELFQSLFK